ncbi:hypothetical protein [Oribacterium sp. C9]|uniref:hypothetical protein n=1 Tax=Oribacterium sp. C9 TaxID=1943579 RepID=UPI001115671A|nr:hypothetical protein [Oribacterium sp. C9]
MIKESLRLDRFYCVNESRLIIHKDYPPFLCMLELMWAKFAGIYREDVVTIALHLFCGSVLVLPIAEQIAEIKGRVGIFGTGKDKFADSTAGFSKKIIWIICIMIFSACALVAVYAPIIALDMPHITSTLLADTPLAIQFGYLLYLIYDGKIYKDRFTYVSFIAVCMSMVMTKQVGIAMLLVVLFSYFLTGFICYRTSFVDLAKNTVLSGAIACGVNVLWKAYVKMLNVSDIRSSAGGNGQFDLGKIDVGTYINVVTGKVGGLESETFHKLLRAFFLRRISGVRYLPVTFATGTIGTLILVWLIHRFFTKDFSREKAVSFSVTWILGTLGYVFMLSILFVFCFTPDEMEELRGYERYVDSFFVGGVLCLFLMLLVLFVKNTGLKLTIPLVIAATVVWAVIVTGNYIGNYKPFFMRNDNYSYYKKCAKDIIGKAEKDSAITLICNDSWYGYPQSIIYYYANENDILWGQDIYATDFSDPAARDAVNSQLEQSDYIYIMASNDQVDKYFSEISNEVAMTPGDLYRVSHGEKLFIEKVE